MLDKYLTLNMRKVLSNFKKYSIKIALETRKILKIIKKSKIAKKVPLIHKLVVLLVFVIFIVVTKIN